jgi:hypothetical protein
MSVAQSATTSRGVALSRTFVAAFEALKEHAKTHPAEVARLYEAIAGHLRSAAPLTLLVSVPEVVAMAANVPEAIEPETHIRRDLGDGAAYDIGISDRFLRLVMVDVTGDDTMHHFEPEIAKAFLDDMRRVLAAMGVR